MHEENVKKCYFKLIYQIMQKVSKVIMMTQLCVLRTHKVQAMKLSRPKQRNLQFSYKNVIYITINSNTE